MTNANRDLSARALHDFLRAAPRGQHAPVDVDEQLARAAEILRAGGLVAFPTETVYGLGADATNAAAVARIFAVKGRPTGHPLIVHVGNASALDEWAERVSADARVLADTFWPGPLTLVVPRSPRALDVVTGGRDTVGVRVPAHPVARALLAAMGADAAIAAPSANRFGRVSPTTAGHVRADLGDEVDLILDGGPATVGVESTIVDCSGAEPLVLRPGGVDLDRLCGALGREVAMWDAGASGSPGVDPDQGARAPGMLAAHYAPAARVEVTDLAGLPACLDRIDVEGLVGVLAPTAIDGLPDRVLELEPAGDPDHFAAVLYDRLRQADRLGLVALVVVPPEARGIGVAVRDRLHRAATGSKPDGAAPGT